MMGSSPLSSPESLAFEIKFYATVHRATALNETWVTNKNREQVTHKHHVKERNAMPSAHCHFMQLSVQTAS